MEHIFLGWTKPCLHALVELLVTKYRHGTRVDLSHYNFVFPTSRAGRRFLILLAEEAGRQNITIEPPHKLTVGAFPELLYERVVPFASELAQQMAWVQAMQSVPPEILTYIIPEVPTSQDKLGWITLGAQLAAIHLDLAADAISFSDVIHAWDDALRKSAQRGHDENINVMRDLPNVERKRWEALHLIQKRYHKILDAEGLWDRQSARLYALRNDNPKADDFNISFQLALVGCVDLNRAQKMMLDRVSSHVEIYTYAPESESFRFDEYGCVKNECWWNPPCTPEDEQILQVDTPEQQGNAVMRWIGVQAGKYAAEDITVGLSTAELAPFISEACLQAGIKTRYVASVKVGESGPFRFLEAVAQWVSNRRYADYAALLRHPDYEIYLRTQRGFTEDWIKELDSYFGEHLPYRLLDSDLKARVDEKSVTARIWDVTNKLLSPFMSNSHANVPGSTSTGEYPGIVRNRTMDNWAQSVIKLLATVYGKRVLNPEAEPDRTILRSCKEIRRKMLEEMEVPDGLDPHLTDADALKLFLEQTREILVPPAEDSKAVEMLGWMDLALDDVPATILAGMNEGLTPESVNEHIFLPNTLREMLGIMDNDRRFARDAYTLASLMASRESLAIVFGRRDMQNTHMQPSRLLLTSSPEKVAQRVFRFFQDSKDEWSEQQIESAQDRPPVYERPSLRKIPYTEEISVTAFKSYLQCPYRYYLSYCENLMEASDRIDEMDALHFGTLLHDIFYRFGTDEINRISEGKGPQTDPDVIFSYLSHTLDSLYADHYGRHALPTLAIQREQMRDRLRWFANSQALHAAQGWGIKYVEKTVKAPLRMFGTVLKVAFYEPNATEHPAPVPVILKGRLDRVDFNPNTGEWLILDYKTGDVPRSPEEVHNGCKPDRLSDEELKWLDLQLPMYRHFITPLTVKEKGQGVPWNPLSDIDGKKLKLGYILLSREENAPIFQIAHWTDAQLRSADETAANVVSGIRSAKFQPTADDPYYDPFKWIIQD